MKILIVTETLYEGGAELFVLRLARKLREMNIDAEVLSLNTIHENKELTATYKDLPIQRLHIPFQKMIEKIDRWLLRLGIDFSIKYRLQAGLIKRKLIDQYDVIHTNYILVDYLFAKLNSKKKKFRQVVTVHGDYSAHWENEKLQRNRVWLNLFSKLEILIENIDKWVIISEEQRKFFNEKMRLPENRLTKIYNGFEPLSPIESKEKSNKFTIGMVSRGEPQKGWQQLINAFLKMPDGCQLVLVGDSDYLQQLKKSYKDHPHIIFTGFHANPVQLIQSFDLLVLPTQYPYESLPTVIVEAIYCMVPVIATNTGEIESMITDSLSGEKAGMLLELKDGKIDEDQLYQCLLKCYQDRTMLEQMSVVAKRIFEKFDMEKCSASYIKIYRELLSSL